MLPPMSYHVPSHVAPYVSSLPPMPLLYPPRSYYVSSMATVFLVPHLVKFHHVKFEKKRRLPLISMGTRQWRIYGTRGGAPGTPLPSPWPKIYSISCSFYENLPKSDVGTPSYRESLIRPCLVICV